MSVKYTVTYTRPSLDHLFVFELASNDIFYDLLDVKLLSLPGLIDIEHNEIGWLEIKNKQLELRPDLHDKLFGKEMFINKLIVQKANNPYFNPFALEHRDVYVFDTIENLQNSYNELFNLINDQLTDNRLHLTENTISQSVSVNQQPNWLLPFSS
jgi:hypothetical protein